MVQMEAVDANMPAAVELADAQFAGVPIVATTKTAGPTETDPTAEVMTAAKSKAATECATAAQGATQTTPKAVTASQATEPAAEAVAASQTAAPESATEAMAATATAKAVTAAAPAVAATAPAMAATTAPHEDHGIIARAISGTRRLSHGRLRGADGQRRAQGESCQSCCCVAHNEPFKFNLLPKI
jgi:hypothetical protein